MNMCVCLNACKFVYMNVTHMHWFGKTCPHFHEASKLMPIYINFQCMSLCTHTCSVLGNNWAPVHLYGFVSLYMRLCVYIPMQIV